ncbi:hypothetical protein GLOTRDRAFT_129397 [Gloeophyllum trabeum ATCC 11539]|uniref:Uncharacterized protein n=1 Tax=Gloeophyllum trabeum (strain ATCC 11539 / FP-39264 / Madison 617) TaxID=670483 RepID=S7Q506_GLOTA|nr:uncharacterized protein GLOTRDRAFT_129397 [Gloeophyllum trabeum ATCC 11539]EPQ55106.1 hypothetical protein GLOTRDRAFT_129397 [Gloeophyllum trabeum ATCC 11539]
MRFKSWIEKLVPCTGIAFIDAHDDLRSFEASTTSIASSGTDASITFACACCGADDVSIADAENPCFSGERITTDLEREASTNMCQLHQPRAIRANGRAAVPSRAWEHDGSSTSPSSLGSVSSPSLASSVRGVCPGELFPSQAPMPAPAPPRRAQSMATGGSEHHITIDIGDSTAPFSFGPSET